MADTPNDPIQPIRQALYIFMSEEGYEPLEAMAAMTQVAAKIAFDSGLQEKLGPEENRNRWMGGAMLAYDAVSGGKIIDTGASRGGYIAGRRHLSLCSGVGKGAKKGIKHRREKNKMARKSRRSQKR